MLTLVQEHAYLRFEVFELLAHSVGPIWDRWNRLEYPDALRPHLQHPSQEVHCFCKLSTSGTSPPADPFEAQIVWQGSDADRFWSFCMREGSFLLDTSCFSPRASWRRLERVLGLVDAVKNGIERRA